MNEIPGVAEYTAHLQATVDDQFGGDRPAKVAPVAMGPIASEVAARVKEIFFAYTNRMERNAQKTLGPSEIGTPCDRRLVMHLLGCDPVNPGTDNWASFVGTCIHVGLGEMFQWANANTGRFVTEMPLTFESELVPKGTGDLLDRVLCMFIDHKNMGSYSLNKLKTEGPSETYRVQLHTYGMGAEDRGEQIEHVAIIAWPRQNNTLQSLYVWTEPYDRSVAERAIERVERLASMAQSYKDADRGWTNADIAKQWATADDCKFCPFYMPKAKSLEVGCNGTA